MGVQNNIGKRIQKARAAALEDRKMTQAELAKKLDVNRDTVRNWESGRVIPDNERLKKVALVCNVDWRWLLLGDAVNMYEDESVKKIMVDSYSILSSFNPDTEEEQFQKALFRIIGCWGIGIDVEQFINKHHFYAFIKKTIINDIGLYMATVNPLLKKDEPSE